MKKIPKKRFIPQENEGVTDYVDRLAAEMECNEWETIVLHEIKEWCLFKAIPYTTPPDISTAINILKMNGCTFNITYSQAAGVARSFGNCDDM